MIVRAVGIAIVLISLSQCLTVFALEKIEGNVKQHVVEGRSILSKVETDATGEVKLTVRAMSDGKVVMRDICPSDRSRQRLVYLSRFSTDLLECKRGGHWQSAPEAPVQERLLFLDRYGLALDLKPANNASLPLLFLDDARSSAMPHILQRAAVDPNGVIHLFGPGGETARLKPSDDPVLAYRLEPADASSPGSASPADLVTLPIVRLSDAPILALYFPNSTVKSLDRTTFRLPGTAANRTEIKTLIVDKISLKEESSLLWIPALPFLFALDLITFPVQLTIAAFSDPDAADVVCQSLACLLDIAASSR